MKNFTIAMAAPRPASMPSPWQPSVLDPRRIRLVGEGTPDSRLDVTTVFTHYNSNPLTGAVSVKAGAHGAAKQAAPPRGVPR